MAEKPTKKLTVTVELLPDGNDVWHWRARNKRSQEIKARGREEGYFQMQNARRGAQSFFKSIGADLAKVEFVVLKATLLKAKGQGSESSQHSYETRLAAHNAQL